jgi:hypothetical protein
VVIRVCLLFCRTPFSYAWHPGDLQEDGILTLVHNSNSRLKETVREFIKAGEDFADVIDDTTLDDLIITEIFESSDLSDVVSGWLLNDILPAINPAVLDRRFWKQCLRSVVQYSPGHPLLPTILRRCDISMARTGIMEWISGESVNAGVGFDVRQRNDKIKNFRMLVEMSGGLNFIREDFYPKPMSPLFAAMHGSSSFSFFRVALQLVDIDILDLIHFQIEMYPDGWTLERLLFLSQDPAKAQPRDFKLHGFCKLCGACLLHPDREELAWKRKVDRFKHGVDLDAPLNEEEEIEQKELDDAIVDFKNGICDNCHEKKKTRKSMWIPFG